MGRALMYQVDYEKAADNYDRRYQFGCPIGIIESLKWLAHRVSAHFVLEVGCGTGFWLTMMNEYKFLFGLDYSARMLDIAEERDRSLKLIRGAAIQLPFCNRVFDFVFCVHALHHFNNPRTFIHEAHRILRKPGILAIIGMDPQLEMDRWYIYDYFTGTHETDLDRYPSGKMIANWMKEAGFKHCRRRIAASIKYDFIGHEVLNDPILHKEGTSQLSLLSNEEFRKGMAKIKSVLHQAELCGERIVFPVHISLPIVYGFLS
jgi:SAM-dependent methyltransferase